MYSRELAKRLERRLTAPRAFIQVVMGPRQTGKTTAIKQAAKASGLPSRVASADSPAELTGEWVELEWRQARALAERKGPSVLVLDEIQKVVGWSETVKALWDEDSWNDVPLSVVLSGSSSLMLGSGLSESLAGRFELLRSTHWNLSEMSEAFGYDLDDYLMFGGYPGAALLKDDVGRWREYMRDSIIESTISRDVLQMEDVRKPALMRALFELGAQCSAQEISYRKLLGQLDDKGNTDTVRHYLDLLSKAGMMSGLQKYDAKQIRFRASSPRLMVHDPSLMFSTWCGSGDLLADSSLRGHLVESAVGARLIARGATEGFDLYWWRDGNLEVDFVAKRSDGALAAIEVKSGRVSKSGLSEFLKLNPEARPMVVGDRNTAIEQFLRDEVELF